mmetsp:Transcript_68097/g.190733  ORF Transcript_68097/g.190733 Transcript_68097/m.190733 type:complete len:252 (+) Transcript_68097:1234-1989(+)
MLCAARMCTCGELKISRSFGGCAFLYLTRNRGRLRNLTSPSSSSSSSSSSSASSSSSSSAPGKPPAPGRPGRPGRPGGAGRPAARRRRNLRSRRRSSRSRTRQLWQGHCDMGSMDVTHSSDEALVHASTVTLPSGLPGSRASRVAWSMTPVAEQPGRLMKGMSLLQGQPQTPPRTWQCSPNSSLDQPLSSPSPSSSSSSPSSRGLAPGVRASSASSSSFSSFGGIGFQETHARMKVFCLVKVLAFGLIQRS